MQVTLSPPRVSLSLSPQSSLEDILSFLGEVVFALECEYDDELSEFEKNLLARIKTMCVVPENLPCR